MGQKYHKTPIKIGRNLIFHVLKVTEIFIFKSIWSHSKSPKNKFFRIFKPKKKNYASKVSIFPLFGTLTFFGDECSLGLSLAVGHQAIGGLVTDFDDGGHADLVDPLLSGGLLVDVSLLSTFAITNLTIGASNLQKALIYLVGGHEK